METMRRFFSRSCSTTFQTTVLFCAVVCASWIIDRITKIAVDGYIPGHMVARDFIPGILHIQMVHNTGAAWGVFGNATGALAAFSMVVCIAAIVWFFWRGRTYLSIVATVAFGLLIGGGLGNGYDRVFVGYVIDFLNCAFIQFPIFNIADVCITLGIVLLIISLLFESRTESKQE